MWLLCRPCRVYRRAPHHRPRRQHRHQQHTHQPRGRRDHTRTQGQSGLQAGLPWWPFSTSYPEEQPLSSDAQPCSLIDLFFICEESQRLSIIRKRRESLWKVFQGRLGNLLNKRINMLKEIVPIQGSSPGLLHCRQILYCLSHQGSPKITRGNIFLWVRKAILLLSENVLIPIAIHQTKFLSRQ